jgi:hypothetical protein
MHVQLLAVRSPTNRPQPTWLSEQPLRLLHGHNAHVAIAGSGESAGHAHMRVAAAACDPRTPAQGKLPHACPP